MRRRHSTNKLIVSGLPTSGADSLIELRTSSPRVYNGATRMPLTSGAKLGPYEIQSPLGAGGMGEVYRAMDTGLDRVVAVKVLASHLSSSPELKQRRQVHSL